MAGLTLKGIKKIYPGNEYYSVKDFNMEIADKEFIVLVGPSGCGKSTTLRMIAGLEEISEGELCIDGNLVNDKAPKDRDIAMVFQNYALYPHMTVYENMAFGLKLKKVPKAEIDEKVRKAAKVLEIEDLLKKKPKQMSGGQRQRVALGRAIVRQPKVFLMDEPLSNLDAKLRVQMRAEISKLHKELQTTFVYVTHDQTEAMTMGTRIVIMNKGEIMQVDTPQNAYDDPQNLFVAQFIGSPQMNILKAVVAEEAGEVVAKVGELNIKLSENHQKSLKSENQIGKDVYVGIRPAGINMLSKEDNASGTVFEEKIIVAEMMGSETFLHLDTQGNRIVSRIDAHHKVAAGDKVRLEIPVDKISLFHGETEKVIK